MLSFSSNPAWTSLLRRVAPPSIMSVPVVRAERLMQHLFSPTEEAKTHFDFLVIGAGSGAYLFVCTPSSFCFFLLFVNLLVVVVFSFVL